MSQNEPAGLTSHDTPNLTSKPEGTLNSPARHQPKRRNEDSNRIEFCTPSIFALDIHYLQSTFFFSRKYLQIMPRRRLLAPSIALATVETAWAAEGGRPAPSMHYGLHMSDDGQQLKAHPPAAASMQQQRRATMCDSACPDDPTYVSKIGLACADHGRFQCPMFLVLGYDETETAELLHRCVSFSFTVALYLHVAPSMMQSIVMASHSLTDQLFFYPFFLNTCSPVAAVSIVLQIMLKVVLV